MLEKTMAYSLNFNHVKGESHKIADCMSRNPLPGCDAPEYDLGIPVIANRSRRALQEGVDIKDPLVVQLARESNTDTDYRQMTMDVINGVERNNLPAKSELLQMEGDLGVISVLSLDEGDLLIKDGQEILIPKSQRKSLISKLHETHLSDASMLKLARGSFF